jgi:Protein of unknown function (DUF2950)
MNSSKSRSHSAAGIPRGARRCAAAALLATAFTVPLAARAQAPFTTPEAAAEAFIKAIAASDASALERILGKDWKQKIPLGGINQDNILTFLERASQSRVVKVSEGHAELAVGTDPWTLPIPLLKAADGQWRFDPVGARKLIAERRIGANERAVMQVMLAYLDAQREYAAADRNGDGALEYAQKLISSPGRRDGLIWSASLGDESPLGEAFLPQKAGDGYHGYRYRILTGQGAKAPGGARSYLIGPRMTRGYALVAWPVAYGETGIMSFMVASDGVVFQRDLGPQSAAVAAAIRQFDPGEGWTRTQP